MLSDCDGKRSFNGHKMEKILLNVTKFGDDNKQIQ